MVYEKILLVEDRISEDSVTNNILTSLGYEVSHFTSNMDRIFYKAADKSYDIIVLDAVSLKLDVSLASRLDELGIPIIFMIKSSEASEIEDLGIKTPHEIIFRPSAASELQYAVKLLVYKNKTEKVLKDNENKFFLLFKNSPLPYQSLDEDGNFLDVNPAWLKCLGYSKEEVIGKNFAELLAPGYSEHFKKNFPLFKDAGEIHGVEFEMKRKDGTYIVVSYEGKIGYDEIGAFKQTHCIFQDISERKTAQDRINKLYHLYATLSQIN